MKGQWWLWLWHEPAMRAWYGMTTSRCRGGTRQEEVPVVFFFLFFVNFICPQEHGNNKWVLALTCGQIQRKFLRKHPETGLSAQTPLGFRAGQNWNMFMSSYCETRTEEKESDRRRNEEEDGLHRPSRRTRLVMVEDEEVLVHFSNMWNYFQCPRWSWLNLC